MNWTKRSLEKVIKEASIGIEMTKQILQAVKEFEHYAQVNKRFTDHMKDVGCYAYIQKDEYSTTLSISKSAGFGGAKAEFRLYVSHVLNAATLTWDKIKTELIRHDFENRLLEAQERLEVIEKETEEAKELLKMLEAKKFKCFDFYKGRYEIQDAIRATQS